MTYLEKLQHEALVAIVPTCITEPPCGRCSGCQGQQALAAFDRMLRAEQTACDRCGFDKTRGDHGPGWCES